MEEEVALSLSQSHFGQGWARLIVELDRANSFVWEGQEPRERKKAKEVPVRRRYTEVMGPLTQPEEDYFHAYEEPIAKVPSWLKEASTELEKAKKEGKRPVTYAQAVECGVQEKTTHSHTLSQKQRLWRWQGTSR